MNKIEEAQANLAWVEAMRGNSALPFGHLEAVEAEALAVLAAAEEEAAEVQE